MISQVKLVGTHSLDGMGGQCGISLKEILRDLSNNAGVNMDVEEK